MSPFFTLHHVLFSATNIINLHLLLEELYHTIWARPSVKCMYSGVDYDQEVEGFGNQRNISIQRVIEQQLNLAREETVMVEARFLFTHCSLFIIALFCFLVKSIQATETVEIYCETTRLQQIKNIRKSLMYMLIFQVLFLYAMRSIANDHIGYMMKSVHTFASLMWISLHVCSVSRANSIGNSLTIDHCIQTSQPTDVYGKYITYLLIGCFSVGLSAISAAEIFNSSLNFGSRCPSYSFSVVPILVITTSLELLCVQFWRFTKLESTSEVACLDLSSLPESGKGSITARGTSIHEKAVYSMGNNSRDLSKNYLSLISSHSEGYSGEIVKSSDEDEWDNSVDIFCLWRHTKPFYPIGSHSQLCGAQQAPKKYNEVDLFDKSKFSLYEDYGTVDKSLKITRKPDTLDSHVVQTPQMNPTHMQISYILSTVVKTFPQQMIALAILGTVYQANQLCFVAGYLKYLAYSTDQHFAERLMLLLLPFEEAYSSEFTSARLWIRLATASIIIVTVSKALSLVHLNPLMFKLGSNKTLTVILGLSLCAIPMYLVGYFVLITSFLNGYEGIRVAIVIGQLTLVQILIGSIGGLIESFIDDSSLHISQQVLNHHASKTMLKDVGKTNPKVQCIVYSLLNSSFNLLGTAILSSVALVFNMVIIDSDLWHCRTLTRILSIMPLIILIIVLPLCVVIHIRKLRNSDKSKLIS